MYSEKELKSMVLRHQLISRFPKEESFVGFSDGNIFLGSKKNAIKLHERQSGKKPVYFYRAEFEVNEDSSLSQQPLPSEVAESKTEQTKKPKANQKPTDSSAKPAAKEEQVQPKPNEKAPEKPSEDLTSKSEEAK